MGHLTSEDDMGRVLDTLWGDNHLPWGGAPELGVGSPARMLWWPVADAAQMLIERPMPRVWRA